MSGLQNEFFPDNTGPAGSATGRKSSVPAASMNEIIDRAFREPYYRFLLFLAAIWRNWYWALPFSLILGGFIGATSYFLGEEQFTSAAWIRVYTQQPYVAFPQQHSLEQSSASVQALRQIIYSPPVMKDAWLRITKQANTSGIDISEIMRQQDPIKWLSSNVNMNRRAESQLYIVSFTTKDPRLSHLIMESVIDSFMDFITKGNAERSRKDIDNLKVIAQSQKNEIDRLNNDYNKRAERLAQENRNLAMELTNQVQILGPMQMPIPMQIVALEAEISSLQILIKLNQKVLDDEDDGSELPDFEVEATLFRHPVIVQLLTEKVALLDELEKRTPNYKSEDAGDLQKIRKNIDEIEKRVEKTRGELLPELKKQWKATLRQMAHRENLATKSRIEQIREQIESLNAANIKNQTKDEGLVKDVNAALEILTKRSREEQIYSILMQRLSILETELQAQEQVDQISPASFPEFPDDSRRFRKSMMILVLGLMLPLLLAWGRELRNPRFYHLSQFPNMFPKVSRETVAGLPRSGREADMNRREKEAFYFSVDDICNNFCYGQSFAKSGVFLFSSVHNDDGQTLLALSVAEKIAQMKKKPVLLIDTHGESSRLRSLVGVEGKTSLADVLAMRVSINEAIVRDSQQPNLFFLPDGPSTGDSPVELFSDGTFEMLLRELRNHYDTILISTRPMERASASRLLCHFADEVVLAVRLYDTSRKNTERLYERLFDIGKPVTSFLVSGISR